MNRILFAWELGGHFGHLSRLIPVARLLRQRGHDLLFAVKELEIAHQLLEQERFRYIPAPSRAEPGTFRSPPASFTDILWEAGFDRREALAGLVSAWQSLFDLYLPDVLVVQYAPVALMAARLAGIPTLQVDTGFECPPVQAPYPCFRPWLQTKREHLLQHERDTLATINEVCRLNGQMPFRSLQSVTRGDVSLLATLPELDHYQRRRGGRYIGSLFMLEDGSELPWPEAEGHRVLVYLRPFPELALVLDHLRTSGVSVVAFIPGISEQLRDAFNSDRFRISTSRLKLAPLLPDADLAITHAGHGFASACLLAGVPTLGIPIMIEQWMTTRNLERLNIGMGIARSALAAEFAPALKLLLDDPTYKKRTAQLARKYGGYDQSKIVERIANTIERLPEHIQTTRSCEAKP